MKHAHLLLFFFLYLPTLSGQVTLEGRIVGEHGQGIRNINILIYPPGSTVMIAFAVSDTQGAWRTVVNSATDSLDIEVSSIQYRNERRRIANRSQEVPFTLVEEAKQLDVFTVRARHIEQKGDTISFLVSAFAQQQHRSIADVLRTMPGIEVEPSGRILYQGNPINRFYVEGLDLMGGRYSMISNNLPHRSVATVEILENHQPVRILRERVPSHQAAINLRLMRDVTTTGTANLGAGHGPLLWDAHITPMTFTERFQVLNAYQTNNAGRDAAQQLRALTAEGFRRQAERPRQNPEMLGIQALSTPDFNENRFLDNRIHLLNSNALLRLNNDLQLRINLHYVTDDQRQTGQTRRTLFSPVDTLFFAESIENRLHDSYLQGEITLKRNVPENFLNNILRFNRRWDSRSGALTINRDALKQRIDNPFRNISNELRSIKPIGPHLVEFQSFVSVDHSPQQLLISPGRFEHALTGGEPIEAMRQELDMQRLFADHSAGFSFAWRGLTIGPRLGFAYRRQTLSSDLLLQQPGGWMQAGQAFGNAFTGTQTRAYLDTDIGFRRNDLTLSASLPLSVQHISLSDRNLAQVQRLSRVLFDPGLSVDYRISGFWRVRGSWNFSNALGDMDGVHYGFILRNHRNLQQNAAPLSETRRHGFSAFLSYRNPFTSFFNSLSYFYGVSRHNLIYSNRVLPDGTTMVQAILMPNTSYSHTLNAHTSTFLRPTQSTFSLRVSLNHLRRQSLLNHQLFETTNRFITLVPQVNTRLAEWLRTEYRANLTFMQTYIAGQRNSDISILRHFFDIHVFPRSGHYVGLTTEFYQHRGNDHFFADIMYRFTIQRHRIDIEARWLNVFQTATYTSFTASTFSVLETTYILRPSQVMLSVRFSF